MSHQPTFREELRVLRQAAPGAFVFLTVLLLLKGWQGTVVAVAQTVTHFVQSFLGGEGTFLPVLLHTLPLALAAGISAFAIAAGWIRFRDVWSVVALAVLILGGSVAGAFLRRIAVESAPGNLPAPVAQASSLQALGDTLPRDTATTESGQPENLLSAQTRPSATQQLSDIDLFAAPDFSQPPPAEIAPVDLLPRVNGVMGIVTLAVNQLLGFVVAYQPRLFLAAVLAGGWTGWSWQRRLASLKNRVERSMDELIGPAPNRDTRSDTGRRAA